jgi:hypothetical protein
MSDIRDSSSPAPSSVNRIHIPDDSMIIQYEQTDPTRILDNPSHSFGNKFSNDHVNEKMGVILVELLEKYQKLSTINSNITIQTVKHDLQKNELKASEIYDILDKFYVDLPDINCVNSSWLTPETLVFISEKQKLHKSIKEDLVLLQKTIENSNTESNDKESEQQVEEYINDEDDEIKPQPKVHKKAKGKNAKTKKI